MPISCVIIEDEDHAAELLESQLKRVDETINVMAKLDTISEAVKWLSENTPDLIFMDIELGDGLCFEIFDHIQVNVPIIFVTSYNQYAIKSFEQNSIGYILKPTTPDELKNALYKYTRLFNTEQVNKLSIEMATDNYQQKFIVYIGNVFKNLTQQEIAYFRLQEKRYLIVCTLSGEQFLYDSSLERLEERLNPELFFRINRQFIVHRQIINKVQQLDRGRFLLFTTPVSKTDLIVSTGRSKEFKEWFRN